MMNNVVSFFCLVALFAAGCGNSVESDDLNSHNAGLNTSSRLERALNVFQGYYGEDGLGRVAKLDVWATFDLNGDDLKVTSGNRPLGTQGTSVHHVQ